MPPPRMAVSLPPSVDVVDFAATRSAELRHLRALPPPAAARVYQQLPWHARRRTMSHSSRRLPRRLLAAHKRQLARPDRPTGPRLRARARKLRKRARFATAVRALRCAGAGRLETHVWHAKRFAMTGGEAAAAAGGSVAVRCNDRGFRSCYRAVKAGCVVHDASYLAVVEVGGGKGERDVLESLRRRLSLEDGRRVATDPVRGGSRCIRDLVLLGENEQPVAMAEILLWTPQENRVWIWVAREVKNEVVALFTGVRQGCSAALVSVPPLVFALHGPRAGTVLAAVLGVGEGEGGLQFITGVRSPACLPAGCVYSGACGDPRQSFPPKTMGLHHRNVRVFGKDMREVFKGSEGSELWLEGRREYWREVVAAGKKESVDEAARKPTGRVIPFILVQTPGTADDGGFASGWDLIVPAGWGMPFWLSLMYANGARAFGQEEKRLLRLEAGLAVFPDDFADTAAGSAALRARERDLAEVHARRPKGKRVNYALYRIGSPMYPAVETVAARERAQAAPAVEAEPLRKRMRGREAAEKVGFADAGPTLSSDDFTRVRMLRSQAHLRAALGAAFDTLFSGARARGPQRKASLPAPVAPHLAPGCTPFVCVRLEVRGRGVARDLAVLCEPVHEDVADLKKGRFAGLREGRGGSAKATAREVVGCVTVGGYSLTKGNAVANGVVSVAAVRRLVERGAVIKGEGGAKRLLVLFRNVSSLEYHAAAARVIA